MRQATDLRRKQIGEVVLDILINEGPTGVTVAAVAERIGVVPSALYRHYGNLEAMLEAGLGELRERLEGLLKALMKDECDPLERLRLTLINSRAAMPLITAMPKLLFSKVDISGNITKFVECLQDDMLAKWEFLFSEAQATGRIRTDVSASTLALMYWGMLTHSFLRWAATEGEFDVEKHLESCWRLFFETLTFKISDTSSLNLENSTSEIKELSKSTGGN